MIDQRAYAIGYLHSTILEALADVAGEDVADAADVYDPLLEVCKELKMTPLTRQEYANIEKLLSYIAQKWEEIQDKNAKKEDSLR